MCGSSTEKCAYSASDSTPPRDSASVKTLRADRKFDEVLAATWPVRASEVFSRKLTIPPYPNPDSSEWPSSFILSLATLLSCFHAKCRTARRGSPSNPGYMTSLTHDCLTSHRARAKAFVPCCCIRNASVLAPRCASQQSKEDGTAPPAFW